MKRFKIDYKNKSVAACGMITGAILVCMGVIQIIFNRGTFIIIWTLFGIGVTAMYTYNFFRRDENEADKTDSEIDRSDQENK